jgi:hypothetical protein
MLEDADESQRIAHIVARAWSDAKFRERLISHPIDVFSEYQLELPSGIEEIRVVENTSKTMYFLLPAKPTSVEHLSLSRLPITILDSPCHGHEGCGRCREPCA